MVDAVKKSDKITTSAATDMTIGKSNEAKSGFGKFMMNDFVIYYTSLDFAEVEYLYGGKGIFDILCTLQAKTQ